MLGMLIGGSGGWALLIQCFSTALAILALVPVFTGASVVEDATVQNIQVVLERGTWTNHVRSGRVAIEDVRLAFCSNGDVRERIADDTGVHESRGRWKLLGEGDCVRLDLSGGLRTHGRYCIRYDERADAIELINGDPALVVRYVHDGRRLSSEWSASS